MILSQDNSFVIDSEKTSSLSSDQKFASFKKLNLAQQIQKSNHVINKDIRMSERRTQSPKNLDSNSCVKLIAKVNKLNQSSKQSPHAGNFKSSSEVKLEYNTSTKWIATDGGNKKMYHQSRQRDNLLP